MDKAILDSDILSEVLKQRNQLVRNAADLYLVSHKRFTFSAITAYEIVRGLQASGSTTQLRVFAAMADTSEILNITMPILMRAAELWATGRNSGQPLCDADLIIAATALELDYDLVTGNTSHYNWISGLRLLNWR